MSGLMNKVKNALHGEKNTPEAAAANRGKNEYGHDTHTTGHHNDGHLPSGLEGNSKGSQLPGLERGEGIQGSVAQGSSTSATNPGVLHSTKPGIHGMRDSGTGVTSGYDNTGSGSTGRDAGTAGAGVAGAATGTGLGNHSNTRDRDVGVVGSGSTGPQFTGDNTRDTGLVGSGLTGSGANTSQTGSGMAGSGDRHLGRDAAIGAGVGGTAYEAEKHHDKHHHGHHHGQDTTGTMGTTGTTGRDHLGRDAAVGTGVGGAAYEAEKHHGHHHGQDAIGTTGTGAGLTGNTRDTGLTGNTTGAGYNTNTRDSGLVGAGTTGTSGGLAGSGSGHYRGDGHPEDIVHPGPHITETANILDPHKN